MNRLPAHRQCINGRTWGRQWNPADFDPITHYQASSGIAYRGVWLALVVIAAATIWSLV